MLAADLAGHLSLTDLQTLKQLDWQAWLHGERILFVPTFYACGCVPV
jgi:hypothetical protein